MIFRSRFLDHEPFSTLRPRVYEATKTLEERAEEKLRSRLVGVDRLMYRGGEDRIFDTQTRRLFTGKVLIDTGKDGLFERILRIKDGIEKAALVRIKKGKNYHAEIVGGASKKFKTGLSPEELAVQEEKLLEADKNFYEQMKKNFFSRRFVTIKKQ